MRHRGLERIISRMSKIASEGQPILSFLMTVYSTGAPGTPLQKFEKDTWPHFYKLAKNLPAAGIHFQSTCTTSGDFPDPLLAASRVPIRLLLLHYSSLF